MKADPCCCRACWILPARLQQGRPWWCSTRRWLTLMGSSPSARRPCPSWSGRCPPQLLSWQLPSGSRAQLARMGWRLSHTR